MEAFPHMDEDFFRSPMEEAKKHHFMDKRPKNARRNLEPPSMVRIHNTAPTLDDEVYA